MRVVPPSMIAREELDRLLTGGKGPFSTRFELEVAARELLAVAIQPRDRGEGTHQLRLAA